ncbi:MAG: hypothetical protein IPN76_32030 [Saprospiraceae bacterium]|nr:hypothetical protein [Saprospiraceae bacterium]
MKKLLLTAIIVLAFGQSSCDLLGIGEDKVCGDKKEGYYFRTSHGTGFFTDATTQPGAGSWLDRTYYQGSDEFRSTIILEKWVQHVCPDKHVKVNASISANIEGDFNVTSKVYWYFFFEVPLTLTASNDGVSRSWSGGDDGIGLKQAYGESGEGEFSIQATIDFPYQGSFEADTMYLFNKLQNVTLEAVYYDVK